MVLGRRRSHPRHEFDPQFAVQELLSGEPFGVYHWNSIEYTGTGTSCRSAT